MRHYLLGVVAAAAIITGCETKAQTGALVGGGIGVGTGALIAGPEGALIGGAVGAIGGAVIGASLDDSDRENVQRENSRTLKRVDNGEQLSVHDIISLHKAGVSDSKIIELIQKTGSRYNLTTYKIERLRNAGVSDTVINYMMNT
ncbi:MAG: hypothetical protein SP1CHLAM54_14180 [Chlamydiia bacterium]|nr:hypothetical protein [Chlamydiia bacterium]MCH9616310.1 hypothetical protein [Chlamydiia bacterium]MCH9629704.1 hypothetical protein [Chlamydiia bacterium]